MIKKFLSYYLKKIRRYFRENTKSRVSVAILMVAAVFLLAFGIFYLTREGLASTQEGTDPFLAQAVPLYIYQLFFLITGFLIFVSSSIFGLFNFFKGEKNDWIMATPKFEDLSWVNFLRALTDSSWPIFILALPLLLAVQNVFNFTPVYFLLALMSALIFSLFASGSAIVLIFLISLILKVLKIKSFKALALITGLISISIGGLVWSRIVNIDISKVFQVQEAIDPSLLFLKENFSIFPSYFPSMTVFAGQMQNMESAVSNTAIIAAGFIAVLLLFVVLKKKFLYIWQSFQEGSFEAKTKKEKVVAPLFSKTAYPKSKEDTIFKKELLVSLRSARNLFWFGFLMILMFAQVGVVNLLERYVGIGASQEVAVAGLTPSLQIGVILFFINALILRFVFPALSQEGSTSWILGSAPIDLERVFNAKFKFYGALLTIIGIIALSIYIIPLTVSFQIAVVSLLILTSGILTSTMLGLSIGTIFLNFKTDDPQRLSTSGPGIGFTLISLAYGGFGAYLLYEIFSGENYLLILLFLAISIIIYKIAKTKALNSLENLEFL